jgi:cytochrome c2
VRAARPVKLPRPFLAGVLAVGLTVATAACGTGGYVKGGDVAKGKQLFSTVVNAGHGQKYACATCHTLAAAGAVGTIGPNLDNAFSADRQQGFPDSSIQQVVADQIRGPLQGIDVNGLKNVSPTGTTVMPAGLVKGKDLTDVTAFVAACAGNPTNPACTSGAKVTATNGKTVFLTAGCSSCHTFTAAGSSGTIGPDLDHLAAYAQKANQPLAKFAREAIIHPPAPYVPPGYPTNVMPTSFGQSLSATQINALVAFLTHTHK